MAGTSVTPVVTTAAAPGTTVQWPAAASELCEVVLTECLRQQHTVAAVVHHQQQHPVTVVTTAPSTNITHDHEVPALSTVAMEDVLRGDISSLHGQTILAPGTTLTLPLQVVSTVSHSTKSRRCSHSHHHGHHHHSSHHHHHHHHQEKYIPYAGRYRLPSADLLPNHEELMAAGAIPMSTPQTMMLTVAHPQPQAPPPQPQQSPPAPTPPAPSATKQRKPRAKP
ncbi:hypothetical protein B566_EDAN005502, partial [Ephemera danica]